MAATWVQDSKNPIKIKKNYALIFLKDKKNSLVGKAKIDIDCIPKIKLITWYLTTKGYATSKEGTLKKLILGKNSNIKHGHLNSNILDCRVSNLISLKKERKTTITVNTPNLVYLKDDHAILVLRNRKGDIVGEAILDLDDVEKVSKYKWYLANTGYAASGKAGLLHRFLLKVDDGYISDHINRKRLDCRKSNLRQCSVLENARNHNLYSLSTTGAKGVTWLKINNCYMSQITVDRKNIYLGSFTDLISAAKAYNKAAKKYHGEFAKLNNIKKLKEKKNASNKTI